MQDLTEIVTAYVLDTAERGTGETLAQRYVSGASQDDADRERSTDLMRDAGVLGDSDAEEGIRRVTGSIWDRACKKPQINDVGMLIAGLV